MAFPPNIKPGDLITADFLNAIIAALLRNVVGDGKYIGVSRAGNNLSIKFIGRVPGVQSTVLAKITARGASEGYYQMAEALADRTLKTNGRTWTTATLGEAYDAGCGKWGLPIGSIVELEPGAKTDGTALWRFVGIKIGETFPVLLTQTGGSAGDASSACSFTYTVNDLDSAELATAKTPLSPRPDLGAQVAATRGLAYWDAAGALQLLVAYENDDAEACS